MPNPRRTLILLSAKRCGSTATFQVFQKHSGVGVCHVDQGIYRWEPNFWNLAAQAIDGNKAPFEERFSESHPFLNFPKVYNEDTVFSLWNNILEHLGPIVFDKSPQYLGDYNAFELLKRYILKGNDVRIIGIIRDARDAITSQFESWNHIVENDSPERREKDWLIKYRHLEEISSDQEFGHVPIYRYEDLSSAPALYFPQIFNHFEIPIEPNSYDHFTPVNFNRYSYSCIRKIRKWSPSGDLKEHLIKFGYKIPQYHLFSELKMMAKFFRGIVRGI